MASTEHIHSSCDQNHLKDFRCKLRSAPANPLTSTGTIPTRIGPASAKIQKFPSVSIRLLHSGSHRRYDIVSAHSCFIAFVTHSSISNRPLPATPCPPLNTSTRSPHQRHDHFHHVRLRTQSPPRSRFYQPLASTSQVAISICPLPHRSGEHCLYSFRLRRRREMSFGC